MEKCTEIVYKQAKMEVVDRKCKFFVKKHHFFVK